MQNPLWAKIQTNILVFTTWKLLTTDQILLRTKHIEACKRNEIRLENRSEVCRSNNFNKPGQTPDSEQRLCPKLEPYKPVIDSWLLEGLSTVFRHVSSVQHEIWFDSKEDSETAVYVRLECVSHNLKSTGSYTKSPDIK